MSGGPIGAGMRPARAIPSNSVVVRIAVESWCRRTTPTTPAAGTSLTALTARQQRIRRGRTDRRVAPAQHALLRRPRPACRLGEPRWRGIMVATEASPLAHRAGLPGQYDSLRLRQRRFGWKPLVLQPGIDVGAGMSDRCAPVRMTAIPGSAARRYMPVPRPTRRWPCCPTAGSAFCSSGSAIRGFRSRRSRFGN